MCCFKNDLNDDTVIQHVNGKKHKESLQDIATKIEKMNALKGGNYDKKSL